MATLRLPEFQGKEINYRSAQETRMYTLLADSEEFVFFGACPILGDHAFSVPLSQIIPDFDRIRFHCEAHCIKPQERLYYRAVLNYSLRHCMILYFFIAMNLDRRDWDKGLAHYRKWSEDESNPFNWYYSFEKYYELGAFVVSMQELAYA